MVVYLRTPDTWIGEWLYLSVVNGAAFGAWLGHRRVRGTVSGLIAVGVTLSALGDTTWQVFAWVQGVAPDVSICDLGWLGSYAVIGAALLVLLHAEGPHRLDVEAWIDIGLVTLVVLLVQWPFSLSAVLGDSSTPVHVRVVWALYPALDSVLVALVLRAVIAGRLHWSAATALAAGASCWFLSDLAFALTAPTLDLSVWMDVGWMVGAVLLVSAAWRLPSPGATPAVEPEVRVGFVRISLALVPLLIPEMIEVVGWVQGRDPNPVPLFLATVGLVGLALARGMRISRRVDEAQAMLRSAERRASIIAENAADASVIIDPDGVLLARGSDLAALLGEPSDLADGTDASALVSAVDDEAVAAWFARVRGQSGVSETEVPVRRPDGRLIWLAVRAVDRCDDPDIGGIVVNLRDVTARKTAERQLAHQAFHDGLTGLANRALFADRVQQALRRRTRSVAQPAVIFLDLDGFKVVNDSLGHGPGDTLLSKVGERLGAAVRASDTIARLGGDEFGVLVEQSTRPIDEAVTVAERILAELSAPFDIGGKSVTISASLGIAAGDPEATAASLLRDADVAMYRAKASGKGCWAVHDTDMRAAALERMQLETDLVGALEAGQFSLRYQPVVALETSDVVGFEALIRWNHPTLGMIMPDRFIPLAENNGLIVPIGAWVLREACATAARWHENHPDHDRLTMAVNVSARQIASPDLLVDVAEALSMSGLDPARLVIELTETALIQDPTTAAERLHELRRLGVSISIDDFGTGYSSLSYLRQFPVDVLKIDRTFIDSIDDRDQTPPIVARSARSGSNTGAGDGCRGHRARRAAGPLAHRAL